MYAITHEGKAIGPSGLITDIEGTPLAASDAQEYNQVLEAQEIAHIKTGPDKLMLYIGHKPMEGDPAKIFDVGVEHYTVQTWLGTRLAWAWGSRAGLSRSRSTSPRREANGQIGTTQPACDLIRHLLLSIPR